MSSLQEQYEKEMQKSQRPARRLKRQLKRVYVYYWLIVLLETLTLQFYAAIYSILLLKGIQKLVTFLTKWDYRKIQIYVQQEKLTLLQEDKAPSTWNIIYELAEDMHIDLGLVSVWISTQNSYLPSICQYEFPEKDIVDIPNDDLWTWTEYEYDFSDQQGRKYHLILPKNLLALSVKNKGHAKALIAHEFGHILQKDADLWLTSYTFSQNYLGFHLLLSLLSIAGAAVSIVLNFEDIVHSALPSTIEAIGIAGTALLLFMLFLVGNYPLLNIWRIQYRVTSFRRKSERLADYASVIYNSADDLLECFESYFEKKNTSLVHPKVADRERSVLNALAKYPQIRRELVTPK